MCVAVLKRWSPALFGTAVGTLGPSVGLERALLVSDIGPVQAVASEAAQPAGDNPKVVILTK